MRLWFFAFVPTLVLLGLQACHRTPADGLAVVSDASTTAAEVDASLAESTDGGAPRRLVLQLAAASFVASVIDAPEWPESDGGAKRLGYLRNGAVVNAYDPPVRNDECKDGWYELVEGGWVCGKVATIDLTNPRVKLAPKQPDRDAGMPYRYGINVSDGTPLYRRVLNAEDRRRYERIGSSEKKDGEKKDGEKKDGEKKDDDAKPDEARANDSSDVSRRESSGTESSSKAKTDSDDEPPLAQTEDEPPPPRRHSKGRDHRSKSDKKRNDKPERDPFKGDGRPSLKELKGRGVLVRRLARGFTIALDRDFKGAGTRWWRTTFGFAVPYDRIVVQGGVTKYAGNWFNGAFAVADLLPLPYPNLADLDGGVAEVPLDAGSSLAGSVAFVTSGSQKIEVESDGKGGMKTGWGGELPRRSAVLLTGRELTVSGVTYHQTTAGFWVHLGGLRMAHPAIPEDVGPSEKWIDVDLTRQQLVAFEGRRPVFATLISSGRRNPQDKEHDFPTPPGTYRVREKHVTTTMDGDVASDGPYSIEDVPWVMYFQGSYALHGAFWHDGFGGVRSHGCVNLSPEDARTLFNWAEPSLPANWHGVFSKDENTGSRVVVHEDPPPKRR